MTLHLELDGPSQTQLLKAVFFGVWMKNAGKTPEDRDQAMDQLVQTVLGALHAAGERDRVVRDAQGRFTYSPAFEAVLFEQVDEYDDELFWEELVDHLAQRDYWQKNPGKAGKPLEGRLADEAQAGIDREKDKYDKEFEERGVERLRIVR